MGCPRPYDARPAALAVRFVEPLFVGGGGGIDPHTGGGDGVVEGDGPRGVDLRGTVGAETTAGALMMSTLSHSGVTGSGLARSCRLLPLGGGFVGVAGGPTATYQSSRAPGVPDDDGRKSSTPPVLGGGVTERPHVTQHGESLKTQPNGRSTSLFPIFV